MPRATRSITHYRIGFVFTPGSLFVAEDADRFNRGEIACSESFHVYRRKATSRRRCIRVIRKWTTSLFHLHGARTDNVGWKSKCEVVRGNTSELARGRKLDTTERGACREYRGFVDFLSREGLTNRSAAVSSPWPVFFVSLTGSPALFFFSASLIRSRNPTLTSSRLLHSLIYPSHWSVMDAPPAPSSFSGALSRRHGFPFATTSFSLVLRQ